MNVAVHLHQKHYDDHTNYMQFVQQKSPLSHQVLLTYMCVVGEL